METRMVELFKRMAKEAIYTELQCHDIEDRPSPSGRHALAVLSEPIQNKVQLGNTTVSPSFRYFKPADKAFLFIEIEFLGLGRNIVLGANYSPNSSTAFIKAAISLGSFCINDRASIFDGAIQIPVMKPAILEELLNEIDDSNATPSGSETQKRWWELWKGSPTNEPSKGIAPSKISNGPSEKKSFTGKTKKCVNCGVTFPENGLQCSACGSQRFIWE